MSPAKADSMPPPKIAIKGFSLSSKPPSKSSSSNTTSTSTSKLNPKPTASTLGKRPRPRSTFASHSDSDSGSDSGHRRHGKVEAVHGFEDGGAVKVGDREKGRGGGGALVIPKLANRDWKAEARGRIIAGGSGGRGGKNLLPPEVQAAQEAARKEKGGKGMEEGVDVVNSKDGDIEWGLSVRKRVKTEELPVDQADMVIETQEEKVQEKEKPRTADEEALAALLGQNTAKKGPDLVISSTTTNPASPPPHLSETDAYRLAIASAPEASTLEDYERVPVEEFGAALLRGMGWKGETHGRVKDVKRRQNLLGLGAKELKEAEELGAWVHKSDVKRLNPGSGGDRRGGGERKPKASEYRREEERRREKREERVGGSYRREKERDGRDSGRGGDRDRDGYRERERRR